MSTADKPERVVDARNLREHYLRALIDNIPFLVWLKDENGRYVATNRPFAESCGYSSGEQIEGLSDFDIWPADLAEAYRADDHAVMTGGRSRIVEEPVELDGNRFWYETYKSPVTVSGEAIGTVGFSHDVTPRREGIAELRASEERLRLAKTSSNLGIFDHDITSDKIVWDERMREIWGVGPDEPVSYATFIEGVHPDDRVATQSTVSEAMNPGSGEYCVEYRVINRIDGKVRHVAVNGQVFFEAGHAVRLVGTLRDISAQALLTMEVRERRSEMEQLIKRQVAAQTAAAIAHELNQPLASISVYSEAALRMLRDDTKSTDPKKLRRALEGAVEQAQRAGRTLHELLDFLHKGETVSELVDLNEVVHEALAIATENGYGGFRQLLELEREMPPVRANRLQLQKILVNLLRNSVDAMRGAGVPAETLSIRVQALAGQDMAQVTIQDNGPGLGAETALRIFEPFFTTKPDGVGLGLAISRALVEAHGGQLWIEPENGPGATFHFTWPFAS